MNATIAVTRVYGVGSAGGGSAEKQKGGRVIVLDAYPGTGWHTSVALGEPVEWVFRAEHLARVMVRTVLTGAFGRANTGVESAELIEEMLADESIGPSADERDWWITITCERAVEWPDDEWTTRPYLWVPLMEGEALALKATRDVGGAMDVLTACLGDLLQAANTVPILNRVYFRAADKPPVRLPEFSVGNVMVTVSKALTAVDVAALEQQLRRARPASALRTAAYWWARAREEKDPWKRFQFAFAGLEVLAHKMAKMAHGQVVPQLRAGPETAPVLVPGALIENPERLPLAVKFGLVALLLTPVSAVDDTETFKALMSARNRFAHGDLDLDAPVPDGEAVALLSRFLPLALAHLSA